MGNRSSSKTIGNGFQKFDMIPQGWLTVKDYSKRAGITQTTLSHAVRTGKFPTKHLAQVRRDVGAPSVIIDWNATVYDYIYNKPMRFWPEDFEQNDSRQYKPLPVGTKETSREEGGDVPESNIHYEPVTDIHSAKLRHEQLRVKKLENEIKQADNITIPLKEVIASNKACAIATRTAIQGSKKKMIPKLCTTNDPRKIERILDEGLSHALKKLGPMEGEDNGSA